MTVRKQEFANGVDWIEGMVLQEENLSMIAGCIPSVMQFGLELLLDDDGIRHKHGGVHTLYGEYVKHNGRTAVAEAIAPYVEIVGEWQGSQCSEYHRQDLWEIVDGITYALSVMRNQLGVR